MLSVTRRTQIKELLKENEQISTQFLTEYFNVSGATIRNDLKELEKEGFLKRIHGGATISEELVIPKNYMNFHNRSQKNVAEKKSIAKEAAKHIKERHTILLDASSTVLYLAPYFKNKEALTVLTNGLFTALTIKHHSDDTNVILVGGMVRKNSGAIEGLLGESILGQINGDIMLTSAHGFNLEDGLTDFNFYEVELKKRMVKKSKKLIALIDHTKINYSSTTSFAGLNDIDLLITDSKTPPEQIELIKDAGVNVIVAK